MRFIYAMVPLLLIAAGLLVGCGGGGTDIIEPVTSGTCTITIHWPADAGTATRYVPTNTNSIVLRLWKTTTPTYDQTQTVNRTSGGTSVCTFTSVPVGTSNLSASAYPNTNGGGLMLATGTNANVVVVKDQTTQAAVEMLTRITQVTFTSQLGTAPEIRDGKGLLVPTSTLQLIPTIKDGSGNTVPFSGTITWLSGNESVATVGSTTGLVAGIAAGTTNITCRLTDGAVAHPYTADFPFSITVRTQPTKYIAWGMEESTGTFLQNTASPGTLTGTISGGYSWLNTSIHPYASTATGLHPYGEYYLGLDGSAYGISSANATVGSYYAAAGWVYITDTNGAHKNVVSSCAANGHGAGYALYVYGNGGKLGLETVDQNNQNLSYYETTTATIPLNTWTHIAVNACALSGSPSAKLYINGEPVIGSGSVVGGYSTVNNNMVFGNYPEVTSNGYVGRIDDIQLYRNSLAQLYTDDEMYSIYLDCMK